MYFWIKVYLFETMVHSEKWALKQYHCPFKHQNRLPRVIIKVTNCNTREHDIKNKKVHLVQLYHISIIKRGIPEKKECKTKINACIISIHRF